MVVLLLEEKVDLVGWSENKWRNQHIYLNQWKYRKEN